MGRLGIRFFIVAIGIICTLTRGQTLSTGIDKTVYEVDLVAAAKEFEQERVGPEKPLDNLGNPLPIPARQVPALRSADELFQATIEVPGAAPLLAKTHLFKDPLRIIPYADDDDLHDAAGNAVPRGDAAIAAYFAPGDVGFSIKHHRPTHRSLKLNKDIDELREDIKLQDTHIGIVVGVMRSGLPGAITCNSPQDYMDGRFGASDYPMIFVRPRLPSFLESNTRKLMMDNLRTMVVGFNAVAVFPSEYNGGDPLGARDPKRIREHVAMMIRGVSGDQDAIEYFQDDKHKIYCAELAFIATSAGLLVPLNEKSILPLLQEFGLSEVRAGQVWRKFQQEISLHNRGQESSFVTMNENKLVRLVRLADERMLADLKPITAYGDARTQALMRDRLAFQPMTVSDIIEAFLKIYVPRQELGEQIAPTQAALMRAMKPGLLEAAALAEQSEAAGRLLALVDQMIAVVEKPYANYDEFRKALEPYLARGRSLTSSRPGDSEPALFVPPMLLHLVARGDRVGGLISLDYVGHGLHYEMVKPTAARP